MEGRGLNPMDGFAWFLNVGTSVVIVFVNKVLLDGRTGHGFAFGECEESLCVCPYSGVPSRHACLGNRGAETPAVPLLRPTATTLCGLHFLACAASVWVVQALGLADRAPLPRAGECCCCTAHSCPHHGAPLLPCDTGVEVPCSL